MIHYLIVWKGFFNIFCQSFSKLWEVHFRYQLATFFWFRLWSFKITNLNCSLFDRLGWNWICYSELLNEIEMVLQIYIFPWKERRGGGVKRRATGGQKTRYSRDHSLYVIWLYSLCSTRPGVYNIHLILMPSAP